MVSGWSTKRTRSDSTALLEHYARLVSHNVYIDEDRKMSLAGRKLCDLLLLGNWLPSGFPVYQAGNVGDVLRDAWAMSEALLQRDVLPIVCPSLMNLNRNRRIELEYFGDDLNAEWTGVWTMGGAYPKPNYVAALLYHAFDEASLEKLSDYISPENHVFFTGTSCFPLVIAEIKADDDSGPEDELLRAVEAAAISVEQQFHLLWAAYGKSHYLVKELYGQPLVFTVCLNQHQVTISAHYALLSQFRKEELEFHRHELACFKLEMDDRRQESKPNTIVENIYRICGPAHLKRIQEAAKNLPDSTTTAALPRQAGPSSR